MRARDPRQRITDNPFHVLGLSVACSRAEVEREGQKLLGMLDLGLTSAYTYVTPLGPQQRTSDKVRAAMAELRDPERRLAHELWAGLGLAALPVEDDAAPAISTSAPAADSAAPAANQAAPAANQAAPAADSAAPAADPAAWSGALAVLGWRRR